ncbi:MAG: prepilin-type N-terminal cleavage/methylation domain-containing protein [Planctomycetaceae bacterium]|nr:prepilin-type N-terminal cleavage/methylation domain-containing protein [Planctomycetaceae bacterium]
MTPRWSQRHGLTLIEVLSAIAVAAIGVFGVLVLVPLASRMSQIGISNEGTRQNATNVVERAKSFGVLNANRWVRWDTATATYLPVPAQSQGTYCVDPMLISAPNLNAALPTTNTGIINVFPYTSGPPTVLPTDRVSLRRATGTTAPVGPAMAESMMGQRTLLTTLPPASDIVPPAQKFVRDLASNAAMRRETEGAKSAIFLVLPTSQPGNSVHRMMSIVVANRRYDTTNFDRVFNVLDPSSATPAIIRKHGGVIDLVLEETDFNPAANSGRPVGNLPSRGWVILVPWFRNAANVDVYHWEYARPYQIRSSDPDPAFPTTRYTVGIVGAPYSAPSVTSVPQPHPIMATRAIYVQDSVDIREMEVRLGTTEY